jgi:hypothetical protein
MNSHVLTIAFISTFAFSAGCGSSTISAIPGATGVGASGRSDSGGRSIASRACSPSSTSVAPADGLIADFADAAAGGMEIPGAIITYAEPKVGGPGSPTYSTSGGALNIRVNAAPTATPQFAGTMVRFNNCIDARAFTGVRFTIHGAVSGCSLQYATGDVDHEDVTMGAPLATGPIGSYPPQNRIAADDLTSTPRTIMAPFARTDIQGSPSKPIDATKLIFVLWQFIVPVAAEGDSGNQTCTGNVTIDDIRFYH